MISRNYLYFLSSVNEDRWRPLTEDEEGTEKVELGKHKSKDTFKLLNMITILLGILLSQIQIFLLRKILQ